MTERQHLIKDCDDLLRDIVRIRDNWTCQKSRSREGVQVAHFFSRKDLTTRWDLDNVCLLNAGVHKFWAHVKHEEFRDWWISRIGLVRFDALRMRNRCRGPVTTDSIRMTKMWLRQTLEEMK